MSDHLPILDELAQATTFSAMAEWLTRCPLAVFASHGHEIESIVAARGWPYGERYVQGYVAAVHARRYNSYQPCIGQDFDVQGKSTVRLLGGATELDKAASLIGNRDLSWHKSRLPAPEVADAG